MQMGKLGADKKAVHQIIDFDKYDTLKNRRANLNELRLALLLKKSSLYPEISAFFYGFIRF